MTTTTATSEAIQLATNPLEDEPTFTGDEQPTRVHWARGNLELLHQISSGVTITGARAATTYGDQVAADLAAAVHRAGHHVVTGMAYGNEIAAVRGTLAAGGAPIIVLPAGINRLYPIRQAPMADAVIGAGGLLISITEDPNVAPTLASIQRRNWWTGTVTGRTILVEAGTRSGALGTLDAARQAVKPIAAVPGPITSAANEGSNRALGMAGIHVLYRTDQDGPLAKFLTAHF